MCMGSDWAATTAHQPNCGSPSSGGCEHDRLKVCLEAREGGREVSLGGVGAVLFSSVDGSLLSINTASRLRSPKRAFFLLPGSSCQ